MRTTCVRTLSWCDSRNGGVLRLPSSRIPRAPDTRLSLQASGATACSAHDGEGCSEKEAEYAEKWRAKDAAEVASQLERLTKMSSGAMKPDAAKWLKQRMSLLKQLVGGAKAEL